MSEPSENLSQALKCPVCREDLASKPFRKCEVCEAPVHRACGEYIGGCATYGCIQAATPRKRVVQYLYSVLEERCKLLGYLLLGYLLHPGWLLVLPLAVLVGVHSVSIVIVIVLVLTWRRYSSLHEYYRLREKLIDNVLSQRQLLMLLKEFGPVTGLSTKPGRYKVDQGSPSDYLLLLWRDELEQMLAQGRIEGDSLIDVKDGKLLPGKSTEKKADE